MCQNFGHPLSAFFGKKTKSPASREIPSAGKRCVDFFSPAVRGILAEKLAGGEPLSLGELPQSLREAMQPPRGGIRQLLTAEDATDQAFEFDPRSWRLLAHAVVDGLPQIAGGRASLVTNLQGCVAGRERRDPLAQSWAQVGRQWNSRSENTERKPGRQSKGGKEGKSILLSHSCLTAGFVRGAKKKSL